MYLIDIPKGSEWGCPGLDPFVLWSGQYPNGPSAREDNDPDKTLRGFSVALDSFDSFFKRRMIFPPRLRKVLPSFEGGYYFVKWSAFSEDHFKVAKRASVNRTLPVDLISAWGQRSVLHYTPVWRLEHVILSRQLFRPSMLSLLVHRI